MSEVAIRPKEKDKAELLLRGLQKYEARITEVMAAGYDHKRLLRMAVMSADKNPKLYECSPGSMIAAVTEAARLGLDVGGVVGEAYLVPMNSKSRGPEVQLRVGYKGLIRLAERSGKVHHIHSEIVVEGDDIRFHVEQDGPHFRHVPDLQRTKDSKVIGAYAIAHFDDGSSQVEWMSIQELEDIRARSATGTDGPWVTDTMEMYKKTVVIRLCKDLPSGTDLQEAAALENMGEGGATMRYNEATGSGEPVIDRE